MFGFEIEFETNAPEVVSYIYQQDPQTLPMEQMHRYHCDCSYCAFGNHFMLRAQTDSSCSGELISKPFGDMDEAMPVMRLIELAATEMDGEPGYEAGFHVHVSLDTFSWDQLTTSDAFLQFLRWENVLCDIARGRFEDHRETNRVVISDLVYVMQNFYSRYVRITENRPMPHDPHVLLEKIIPKLSTADKEVILIQHRDNDRHSNLNVRTRFDTWEFRLWNSTRVAWRMELWCWLSIAMLTEPVVAKLAEVAEPNEDRFLRIIQEWNPRAGELLNRQTEYGRKLDEGLEIGAFSQL